MRITDTTLRQHRKNYIFQPLLGAGIIIILLLLSDLILSETIIASFGATVFIVSTMPLSTTAGPRYLIGGYACGIASGLLCSAITAALPVAPLAIFAGIAVGLTIFLTVALSVEHPPAAALALGLVLSPKPLTAALIAFGGILIVCLVLRLTKRLMKNLL